MTGTASEPPSQLPPFEERVAQLEAAAKRFDAVLDRQLRTLTIIFSAATCATVLFGLVIAALGVYGKVEVSSAVREMDRRLLRPRAAS